MAVRHLLLDTGPLRTSPAFRRLWIAGACSSLGSQMTLVAVLYQVWQATQSATWTGAVGMAQAIPLMASEASQPASRPALTDTGSLHILLYMTTNISLADARAKLSELVGRADEHHERIVITVHGRPAAVLLSLYDFEAMQETLDILADPETMARLQQAEEDIERGDVITEPHKDINAA